jgi:MFS family permease
VSEPRAASLYTRPFVVASIANFFHSMAVMLFLHLPGLLEEWRENELTIGLASASMAAGAVLVRPLAGRAMDGGGGRRAVFVVGGIGHVITCAGYFAVDHVGPLFWIVRVLHGAFEGALFAALFVSVADLVPIARRTEGLALYGISGMLPVALGGLLGDLVLEHGDYQALFGIALALASVALVASLGLPETSARASTPGPRLRGRGFVAVLVQRDLLPIWVVGVGFAGALGAAYAFLKSFVLHEGVGSVGLFYGWYAVSAITLRLTLGWVPDRVGPKRVLGPSLLSIAIALAVLGASSSALHIAIAGSLAGLGHAYVFPVLSALTVARSREDERGSALALFTAVFDAGMLIAGPVFGEIARTSTLRTMFFVAAAVPIVSGLVFYAWDARALDRAGRPA